MKLACAISKMAALMVASTILTGCATPKVRPPVTGGTAGEHAVPNQRGHRQASGLWAERLYQPAEQSRLALALPPDAKDVLVCYDERCGDSPKVQRRAYWLLAYSAKADNHVKPRFAHKVAGDQLTPIPLIDVAESKAAPAKGYCAFADANSKGFHLWRDGQEVGFFKLPVYEAAPPATVWRIGVTAVAVIAVVAVIGIGCMGAAPH